MISQESIITKAKNLIDRVGTNDPFKIAKELGIIVMFHEFNTLRGVYKIVQRNRFIFINPDLSDQMTNIVLWHEIGHDQLHRSIAANSEYLAEFNIFDIRQNRMEYEANVFAAQLAHTDEEVLELCYQCYDIEQIARALNSDINLIALKVDNLISQGYKLRPQEHKNDFLK